MTTSFEARYRADRDPWGTETKAYELEKRARTLAACGPGPFPSACDLGAGLGLLAEQLAPRCARLLALDASPTAIAAATTRLAPFPHAEARVATVPDGLPHDTVFDLIVASEILYYLNDTAFTATLTWLATHLVPGGRLVAVHWTGTAPDLHRDAASIGAALAAAPGFRPLTAGDDDAAGYRLDTLERSR